MRLYGGQKKNENQDCTGSWRAYKVCYSMLASLDCFLNSADMIVVKAVAGGLLRDNDTLLVLLLATEKARMAH